MANPNITKAGKKTQFRPGVSGNPRGRPKGVKNWSTIVRVVLADEAVAKVVASEHDLRKWSKGLVQMNLAHIIPIVMATKVIKSSDVQAANWLYKAGGYDRDESNQYEPPEDISLEEAERLARQAIEWAQARRHNKG